MRIVKLVSSFVLVCLFVVTAAAQQVGDQIVVTADKTPLRSPDATTGIVPQGAVLVVKAVQGDRFWVIWSGNSGWINRSATIPVSQALAVFDQEIKRNPTARAYANRGGIWFQTDEYAKAIADYNAALGFDPKDATIYYSRGLAWSAQGDFDKAMSDWNESLRLDPKQALLGNDRGLIGLRRADYEGLFFVCVGIMRGSFWADWFGESGAAPELTESQRYHNRAFAWSMKGERDKAIADYTRAIRLDPSDASNYTDRAGEWYFNKAYDKAIADCDEALHVDPDCATAYNLRGNIQYARKKYAEAIADYKRCGGDNCLASLYASCPDARFRDGKRAVELATKACEAHGWKVAGTLDILAAAHAESGDFDSAIKWEKKACEFASVTWPKDDDELYTAKQWAEGLAQVLAIYRSHLDLYKAHKPYRTE